MGELTDVSEPRNFGGHYSWARTIFSKAAINMAGNVGNVDIPYIQEPVEEMVHGWIYGFGIIMEYLVPRYIISPNSKIFRNHICQYPDFGWFWCASWAAQPRNLWSQPMVYKNLGNRKSPYLVATRARARCIYVNIYTDRYMILYDIICVYNYI